MDFLSNLRRVMATFSTVEKDKATMFQLGDEIKQLEAEKEKLYISLGTSYLKNSTNDANDLMKTQLEFIDMEILERKQKLKLLSSTNNEKGGN